MIKTVIANLAQPFYHTSKMHKAEFFLLRSYELPEIIKNTRTREQPLFVITRKCEKWTFATLVHIVVSETYILII